jgi:hypothetical protein
MTAYGGSHPRFHSDPAPRHPAEYFPDRFPSRADFLVQTIEPASCSTSPNEIARSNPIVSVCPGNFLSELQSKIVSISSFTSIAQSVPIQWRCNFRYLETRSSRLGWDSQGKRIVRLSRQEITMGLPARNATRSRGLRDSTRQLTHFAFAEEPQSQHLGPALWIDRGIGPRF